jgi:hypothetical protein
MKSKILASLAAATLLWGGTLAAHHSFAGTYVEDKIVAIEGVLVEFNIRNPHSFVTVEVTDKDGKTKSKWGCEWGGVTQLTESGVTRYTLKTGDKVKITGAPARDTTDNRLLLRSLDRPADGFHWGGTVR